MLQAINNFISPSIWTSISGCQNYKKFYFHFIFFLNFSCISFISHLNYEHVITSINRENPELYKYREVMWHQVDLLLFLNSSKTILTIGKVLLFFALFSYEMDG